MKGQNFLTLSNELLTDQSHLFIDLARVCTSNLFCYLEFLWSSFVPGL